VTTFDDATIVLISRPYVVEVLAQLNESPHILRTLHRSCHGTRHELHDALRALAAAGAISRTGTGGSWDTREADEGAYALTAAGHRLVERLSDIDTWTQAYQRYLDQSEPGRAHGRRLLES
jgi:DNA-binding HxlR family transcriptional regulator